MNMDKESEKNIKLQDIEKLLTEQTSVILSAVDEKLENADNKTQAMEIRLLSFIDEKILKSEERINQKIEKLTTTLDNFLKRLTDTEDEFTLIKEDLKKVKEVIKEKLGVDLT